MKRLLFFLVTLLLTRPVSAQTKSALLVHVLSETGEPLLAWRVDVYQGGREVTRVYTNEDGEALAKPLSPNTYEVRAEFNNVTRRINNINLGVSEIPALVIDFSSKPPDVLCTDVPPLGCTLTLPAEPRANPVLKTSGNSALTGAQLDAMPVR